MSKNKLQFVVDFLVKGKKDIKDIDISLKNIPEKAKEAGKATGDISKGTSKAAKGFKALGKAVATTGIGLLVGALTALKTAFTSTEAGQNRFKKLMNAISVITGNLTDILAKLGNSIIAVFENPQEAMESFKEALKKNIETRINATIKMFGLLGSTIKKVFKGDFKGAMDDAKGAASAYVDSVTGVEDSLKKATKAVGEFVEETKKEIEQSNILSDLQAEIDRKERELLVARAERETEISALRLKARDEEKYTAEERQKFLEEAQALQNDIFKDEEDLAKKRLKIQKERNKMSGSTKEDLAKEAELEAEMIRLAKERDDTNRRLFTEQNALRKQTEAEKEEAVEAERQRIAEEIERERARQEELKLITEEYNALKEESNNSALERQLKAIDDYFEARREKLIEAGIAEEDIEKSIAAAKNAVTRQSLAKGLALTTNNMAKAKGLSKEAFIVWKRTAQAQAVVDTYKAANEAYASMAGIPFVGPALGTIAAASAIAAGMANVKEIEKTKFRAESGYSPDALGEVLRGSSHSAGGIDINAEGDEIILTKGVYRNPALRKKASDLNVAGGGRPLAGGGTKMGSGGVVGGSSVGGSSVVGSIGGDSSILGEILQELRSLKIITSESKEIKVTFNIVTSDPETTVQKLEATKDKMQEAGNAGMGVL